VQLGHVLVAVVAEAVLGNFQTQGQALAAVVVKAVVVVVGLAQTQDTAVAFSLHFSWSLPL